MNRFGLIQRFKLFDWNKYSKEYKKKYKDENGETLKTNTAIAVTFNKIQRTFGGIKEPEIEDVVRLVKLGNGNCSDEDAVKNIEAALEDTELYAGIDNTDKASGLLLIFLTLIICFYTDLNISKDLTGRAVKIKQLYIEGLNAQNKDTEKKKDTEKETDNNIDSENTK